MHFNVGICCIEQLMLRVIILVYEMCFTLRSYKYDIFQPCLQENNLITGTVMASSIVMNEETTYKE
jgi:hypothetical protein